MTAPVTLRDLEPLCRMHGETIRLAYRHPVYIVMAAGIVVSAGSLDAAVRRLLEIRAGQSRLDEGEPYDDEPGMVAGE